MFGPALVSLSFALSGPLRPAVHTPSRAATPEMGFRDNKVAVGVASVGGVGVGLLLGGPAQFLVTKAASVVAASIPAQIALSGALGLALPKTKEIRGVKRLFKKRDREASIDVPSYTSAAATSALSLATEENATPAELETISEARRLDGLAMCLERKALETGLQLAERKAMAAERKAGLEAAWVALDSAQEWAAQLDTMMAESGTTEATAAEAGGRRAVAEATMLASAERVQRAPARPCATTPPPSWRWRRSPPRSRRTPTRRASRRARVEARPRPRGRRGPVLRPASARRRSRPSRRRASPPCPPATTREAEAGC